jgi:hypothetical protein
VVEIASTLISGVKTRSEFELTIREEHSITEGEQLEFPVFLVKFGLHKFLCCYVVAEMDCGRIKSTSAGNATMVALMDLTTLLARDELVYQEIIRGEITIKEKLMNVLATIDDESAIVFYSSHDEFEEIQDEVMIDGLNFSGDSISVENLCGERQIH